MHDTSNTDSSLDSISLITYCVRCVNIYFMYTYYLTAIIAAVIAAILTTVHATVKSTIKPTVIEAIPTFISTVLSTLVHTHKTFEPTLHTTQSAAILSAI